MSETNSNDRAGGLLHRITGQFRIGPAVTPPPPKYQPAGPSSPTHSIAHRGGPGNERDEFERPRRRSPPPDHRPVPHRPRGDAAAAEVPAGGPFEPYPLDCTQGGARK